MSLIIKGINLPNTIKYYQILPNGDVYETAFDGLLKSDKPLQAVQIPTPHGRLIDGDKLKKKYGEWLDSVPYINNSFADMGRRDVLISVCYDLTYSAPTILEAEGE